MRKFAYIFVLLLFIACSKETLFKTRDIITGTVPVVVDVVGTKTSVSDNQIVFTGGESMSLICKGLNAARLTNDGVAVNKFGGNFARIGRSETSAEYYAVYPYVGIAQHNDQKCYLPMSQIAPFDGRANYMCSNLVTAEYDEGNMPVLSMTMQQLLGIFKVSFMNSVESYENDIIKEVEITSSTPLTGNFKINFGNDGNPSVSFEGGCHRVLSTYNNPVILGKGKVHDVYIIINPAIISDAEMTIRTDKHVFRKKAGGMFSIQAGAFTVMDPLDLAVECEASDLNEKTLVLWGDSYTNRGREYTHINMSNYAYELGKMLGSSWKIYNGGCSGDVSNSIAARQGGIQLCTGVEFTIPATTTPVTIDGLYSSKDYNFTDGRYTKISRFGMINPMEILIEDASGNVIDRVEGTSVDGTTFVRSEPGEEIVVPAHSKIVTFAAKNLRNPDLTIIYMGQNGGFKTLDVLYKQHRSMIEYASSEGQEHYIVLGFHNHLTLAKWNVADAYWKFFDGPSAFGVNPEAGREVSRFINLYTELTGDNYKEYLVQAGAAASEADVLTEDIDYVSKGMLPYSYWCEPSKGDIHPNEKGAKAIAHIIYNRMSDLGYVK